MDSHGQQRAKQSAKDSSIIRTQGYSSLEVDKTRFACIDEQTLWASVL